MFTAGFIGLGLIGGSIAKALKKADGTIHTIAYNRSHAPLEAAVNDKVIDKAVYEINESFLECDIIFLCTPVEYNSVYLAKVRDFVKKGCIVTDVGSVKGYIHTTVSELGMEDCFIGGHPMAGSEKTGYAAASDILLENAYYAITPTSLTTNKALDFYVKAVKMMGAIPIVVEPQIHDYAVAGISHVPHLIAAALVNTVKENDTDDELMKLLAAGGFKDITRIASSSADMWSQICTTNPVQISTILDKYINYLTNIKAMVDNGNQQAIHDLFCESKEYRDSISIITKGPVLTFRLFCDIEDREGAISSVATLLADNHINIKNIEIIHNREYKDGVLLIEFYDNVSMHNADTLLSENNYVVHK